MLLRSSKRGSLAAAVIGLLVLSLTTSLVDAYQVEITDADPLRQSCSGMWSGKDTAIELSFDVSSAGTVSTLFYEYGDFDKVGRDTKDRDVLGFPVKTYICTSHAVGQGVCTDDQLGTFIIADGANGTSIVTERINLGGGSGRVEGKVTRYNVTKAGYYCIAAVPMTTQPSGSGDFHSHFVGRINFINAFEGDLPATEYPKLQFYFALTTLYMLLGGFWLYLCVRHRDELLMVQHFVSATIALLILGNSAQWGYYAYLNNHTMDYWSIASLDHVASVTAAARTLLVLTSILDAARNSTSLFLLLIVSMGYGVVRPTIGSVMTRVRILTAVHFVCGVLYSIGIVLIVTEQGGGWIFIFIFPLAFTLTAFMMWTLHSLNATIEYLKARKQTFKRQMFSQLYRILLGAVVAIFAFFVLTSIAFSQSGGESFSPTTWPYRWFLLDGWMGILYLVVFSLIAWLWRPTGQNLRLSMSDELAQDEGLEGEDYEIDEFGTQQGPGGGADLDEEEGGASGDHSKLNGTQGQATARNGRVPALARSPSTTTTEADAEEVVFQIGDEDDAETPRRPQRDASGDETEREGLMSRNEENESRETLVPNRSEKRED